MHEHRFSRRKQLRIHFDKDAHLTVTDIDLLTSQIIRGMNPSEVDLINNGFVNTSDLDQWLGS